MDEKKPKPKVKINPRDIGLTLDSLPKKPKPKPHKFPGVRSVVSGGAFELGKRR